MIENKCTQWYESERCTVKNLIEYIEKTGQMRDAQIEAIKVYLFLKIACECKPLTQLFRQGFFNSIDLNEIELSKSTREYLFQNPAAATLFEYACLTNDKGEQVSEKLEKQIKKDPTGIDYNEFFRNAFYGVSYTDYLFSLPMGAGKTYLMAAFIYLDLYFAYNEPTNPSFAHNFIIFAPSGLKSSVVPSLKTIQNFNPSWILPEPAATDIKRMISFEVLDQSKTAKKSNKTKNPNVQKIANHQPLSELFGLVAVTNAEKVILERIQEKQGQINMFEESEDDKDRQANELRNLIGKLPSLSIFIDEVHHAVSDEIKLRAVVTRWAQNHTVNSVIGFSGTPYLDKVEKIKVVDSLSIGTAEITNIVYYYPLIDGVGNFLKRPVVKIADIADSSLIIEKGVREFLDTYKDTVYADGLTAKLGIYCGTIEKLEETVYPQVSRIVAEYGLGTDVILKFHKGNKQYKMSADSQMQFDILDKSISEIRIVLLVQIGKEGWDCRSLTGIILSQEGDCPTNMVLQTSCRCLRQVIKNGQETALIYLNESNAEKLNMQLERQHHISLKEFSSADNSKTTLKRYNRTAYLKLPNFNRILRYKGADDVSMTLQRGMPLYEMEKQETVGENSDGNMVIRGECVSACAYLKEQGIQVDLVYIDPPFASGADYAKKVYIRRNPKVAEVIAQAEQELDVDELKAFEEKMYGDVWDKEKYLNWMYENLMAIKSVMSENASIYVHIDWHIGHYVKILLDEVFGEDNFRNEITWVRTASHNDSKQNYSRVKDSIFFYSRSEEYPFNIQYTPYTEEYIADEWTKAPSGRYYKFENMLDPQNKMAAYDFHGTVARWRTTPEKFEELWNAPQTEVPNSHGRVRLSRQSFL